MKRSYVILAVGVLAVAGAGAGWYLFRGHGDPLQNAAALLQRGDPRGAQIELRNAVKLHPESAEAHFQLGKLQLEQGDAVAAEKEFKTARDLNYDKFTISISLGKAYLAQNRYRDVLSEVKPEGPTPDQKAVALVLRATASFALSDIRAAQAALADAELAAPKNVDARMVAARLATTQRDFPLAQLKLNEALALDPKRGDAFALDSQIKAAEGDRPAAIALMDKAIEAEPSRTAYRLDRAGLALQLGQDAKARADVDTVLAMEPRNGGATYLGLVLLVRAGKFAEADSAVQKLGPTIDRFPRALYFQALIKGNLGQTATAVDFAERYVARTPRDPDGVRLLARAQMANKRPDQAVTVLTKAIAAGQSDAQTLDLLGRAYAMDGKSPLAAETFQNAALLAPTNALIQTHLASTRMQLGDLAGATSALDRSLELAPEQTSTGQALVAAALSAGDLDRAQAALDRLRQQGGETEAVGLLGGAIKLGQLDTEGARAQFAATLAKYPQSVIAKVNLAKVLYLQSKKAEAVTLLNEVLAKNRADPQALTALIPILLQENRVPEAITALEAAQAASPTNFAFTVAIADIDIRATDPRAAIAVLEKQRIAGALPPVLLPTLGLAQARAGLIDDAKATYAGMLAANPGDLDARRGQVEMLANAGDLEGAKTSLRDALKLSPGSLSMMSVLLALELRTGGIDDALAAANRLRSVPANMPVAAVLKGDLLLGAGRFNDAVAAYDAEFKAAASTTLALRAVSALVAAGKPDQATERVRALLARQPGDPDVAQVLASLDIEAKRYPDAEKNLNLVLEKRPNDPVALNNLAWLYQVRGDPGARNLAQRAYLQAQSPESSDTLGWILVSQGDAARAVPLLQQASAQRPADPSIRFHLASALNAAGQKDEAVKLLQALVAEPADFDDKPAARKLLETLQPAR